MLPNETLFIQLVIYLILIGVLYVTFFKPIARILEERDRRTEGWLADAERALREYENLEKDYLSALTKAKQHAFEKKSARLADAVRRAEEVRQKGIEWTERFLEEARAEIRQEVSRFQDRFVQNKAALRGEVIRRLI